MRPYPQRLSRRMFGATLVSALSLPALVNAAPAKILRDRKYGPAIRQALDIYLPQRPQNAPVLIVVHGGGWVIGDKTNKGVWQEKVRHWGAQGYILVSVNYRMVPIAAPLEQARDVARAIAYVQENIAQHGGDPERIVIMGHSAGGHLVALLSADRSLAASQGARPWRACISLDSAAFDIEDIMQNRHAGLYDTAFGTDPAQWRAASPMARLSGTPPPFLLVCSTRRAKSCARATAFSQALTEHGSANQVLPVNLAHNQINTELGKPGPYTQAVDAFLAPFFA